MSFTYINAVQSWGDGDLTPPPLNVAAGDLIVAYLFNLTDPAGSFSCTSASDALTMGATYSIVGGLFGAWGYKIGATADAAAVFEPYVGTINGFNMVIAQWRPSAAVTFDGIGTGAGANNTTITSGNLVTTGTDELVIAGVGTYDAGLSYSNCLINGQASTLWSATQNRANFFYNTQTGTIAASGTITSGWHQCQLIGFKIGAATGTSIPAMMAHYARLRA
jgi:hypothetical protein